MSNTIIDDLISRRRNCFFPSKSEAEGFAREYVNWVGKNENEQSKKEARRSQRPPKHRFYLQGGGSKNC